MEETGLRLIAYEHTTVIEPVALERASPQRDWMDATPHRFAYRCLPLAIANQAGWVIACPATFRAHWSGGASLNAVTIHIPDGQGGYGPMPAQLFISSHFGSGILTFSMPYLFRTAPGYNLWVKGPTNLFKDGIQPMEGMVETDWAHATFTMNWKFTRPNAVAQFEQGEPICQILPYPRGLLESVEPSIQPIANDPELAEGFRRWGESRGQFNLDLKKPGSEAQKQLWQKDYHQGRQVSGDKFPSHQTHLRLQEFQRVGASGDPGQGG